jgi:glycosyltransferase involved in cell wall biosynthesis
VSTVDIILNEQTTVRADLGRERPDVPVVLNEPGAAVSCGWSAIIDLTPWPLGDLRVKVVATSRSGVSAVIAHRLFTLKGEGFEGHLDAPREGSELRGDLLVVQGWATIGQQPASRIDIDLNGRRAGRARLRLVRPDVERHGAGRLGPVTGFEYRGVLALRDEAALEIGVTVHALDGTTVVIPPRHVRVVPIDRPSDEPLVGRFQVSTGAAVTDTPRREAGSARERPSLLVFTHSLAIGGGQLYLSDLLHQLMPTLAGCTLVSPTDGVLRSELEDLGVDVIISKPPMPRDVEHYEDYVGEQVRFILESQSDVVLLNTLGPWVAGDAAVRARVPLLWAIHESFELSDWIALNFGDGGLPMQLRTRFEAALRDAARLIFESEATSRMFAQYADDAHRSVVPYGIDTSGITHFAQAFDRSAARSGHGIPDSATVLLSMGILEERKSQACIVEAFVQVAAVHPEAYLVMVGDHQCEYSTAIRAMINAAACADRIMLLPITSKIWDWYALSDVLVSASDIESLPRSMLECMAFSVPVMSTDVFGVPELVEDGVNGWLFNARDMGALIAAMHRLLSLSPEERRATGAAARHTVDRLHPLSNYEVGYRELLGAAVVRAARPS